MQKLIKDGVIVDNDFHLVETAEDNVRDNSIVPVADWLKTTPNVAGVWLDSHESPEMLSAVDLSQFAVIGINFPAFADGRGFSYARLLRERYHYKGEIRALGNFIPDQLGYLLRVGFNAFAFAAEVDLEKALKLHKSFSVAYQGDVADPRPLFLRRQTAI